MAGPAPAADAPPAAVSAVLEDAPLLELILASAAFESAAECAEVALVSRLWAHVAARDAVWRAAWRRQAGSLRALEPSVARPRGAGFRAALAQMRATELQAQCDARVPWTLADFTVAVDIMWRDRPLLEAAASAVGFAFDTDAEVAGFAPYEPSKTTLLHIPALPASAADAAAQEAALKDCARAGGVDLSCLVRVMRSDGALAQLLEYKQCGVVDREGVSYGICFAGNTRKPPVYAFSGQPLHYYGGIGLRSDGRVKPLHVFVVAGHELGATGFRISVLLCMECQIWPEYVLHALTHTLPWVLPGAGPAAVDAAASWQAPPIQDEADAEEDARG